MLEGELVLILDESETVVRAGDVVVQRGTSHAWANRSASNARIAFVLIDGSFEPGLDLRVSHRLDRKRAGLTVQTGRKQM